MGEPKISSEPLPARTALGEATSSDDGSAALASWALSGVPEPMWLPIWLPMLSAEPRLLGVFPLPLPPLFFHPPPRASGSRATQSIIATNKTNPLRNMLIACTSSRSR